MSGSHLEIKNKGFALIAAVFIIVVLGLMAIYIVRLSTIAFSVIDLSMQGVRAYYAAKSGLEWGIARAVNSASCVPSTTFSFNQGALTNFSTIVTCTSIAVTEATSYTLYNITAQGFTGTVGTSGFVSRTLTIQITQ